ncbi:MAG TPA: beta-ketoacyl-[acyl-carrier-protein] synthase II, partial [Rudaea sp.]
MSARIPPLAITAFTAACAAGQGRAALASALIERRSGLRPNDFTRAALPCWIGRVEGLESQPLPEAWARYDTRNHRLAWLGLAQDDFLERVRALRARYGAPRIALVVGTSTAS